MTWHLYEEALQHAGQRQKRGVPVRARPCARKKTRALVLGHSQEPGGPSCASLAHKVKLPAGRRTSTSRVKETEKGGPFLLTCSVSRLMLRSKRKQSSACGPCFFASLSSLAVTHTHMTKSSDWPTLPVLTLHVQMHHPPAQERIFL